MAKNLLKITATILLSLTSLNTHKYSSKININPLLIETKKRAISPEDSKRYNENLQEIKDNIRLSNAKKNFYLIQLSEIDSSHPRWNFYLEGLNKMKRDSIKYKTQKDSIYRLIKN